METFIPSEDLGTSAGKWSKKEVIGIPYAALIGSQVLTTTTSFSPEAIVAENDWFTGPGQTSPLVEEYKLISIKELRQISGLTWEQLASLFNVSRRMLHYWDNGSPMKSDNEEKLGRILNAIKSFDTGSPSENRRLLLTGVEGCIPIDLLIQDRFEDFNKIKDYFAPRTVKPTISQDELSARSPFSPEQLVDAKQDTIHKEQRRKRKVKVKRASKA